MTLIKLPDEFRDEDETVDESFAREWFAARGVKQERIEQIILDLITRGWSPEITEEDMLDE